MEWLGAVLLVAIGTYLLRWLPLRLALVGKAMPTEEAEEAEYGKSPAVTQDRLGNRILALATPAIIAALLVVAVVPPLPETTVAELVRRVIGLATAAVAYRWRPHLALAVLAGIIGYAAVSIV